MSSKNKVVALGEMMLRLTPPGHRRLAQARQLDTHVAGAEANVVLSLAQFGVPTSFITRLPESALGDVCLQELRAFGVETGHVLRGGDRLGLYFTEAGAAQRASTVVYDRRHSAFSEIKPGDFPWDEIFRDAGWFHFSGITPGLSDSTAETALMAVQRAKALGLTVSFDTNFRAKLWSRDRAREVLDCLMPFVDICLGLEPLVEIGSSSTGHPPRETFLDGATQLHKKYPHLRGIALSLRQEHSSSHNGWSALYLHEGKPYWSREYEIHVVERIGAGDAFTAGLLYAMTQSLSPQETIEFAAAAGCLKHSIPGDFNRVTAAEVAEVARGTMTRRIQR